MLIIAHELRGYELKASDGLIGSCRDFLFDDGHWKIRHVVADTGTWLPGRKVLLPPERFGIPNWERRQIDVDLSRQQIEDAPGIEEDKPVSRQYETTYYEYFNLSPYWPRVVNLGFSGPVMVPGPPPAKDMQALEDDANPHLRSSNEVTGYNIEAADGEIGHVEDFVIDTETWTIRWIVVDTRNWLPGRKVILSPNWIHSIDWGNRSVRMGLTQEAIRQAPDYKPDEPVNREIELRLYDYYGRPHHP